MFFTVDQRPSFDMLPGVTRRAVWMDHVMLTFFRFDPGAVVPVHQHPNEQISYVTQGRVEFTLGDETRILEAGEGVCIPANTEHGARILDESTEILDAWGPPREDYKT